MIEELDPLKLERPEEPNWWGELPKVDADEGLCISYERAILDAASPDPRMNSRVADYGALRGIIQRRLRSQRELVTEIESLRAFKRSVDEALNSGDGTYRP